MPSLEKEQLLSYFNETYHSLVRRNRCGPNRDQEEHADKWESAFPGRAIASFYLQTAHQLTTQKAAEADVDGGQDEGIDSIHYDPSTHQLILIQAKGGGDGPNSQPSLADVIRFIDGAKDYCTGNHDSFGELSPEQKTLASTACQDTQLRVEVVLAHFGGELQEDRKRRFEQLKAEFNQRYGEERMTVINFNRNTAHRALLALHEENPVNCRIKLQNYSMHEGELKCFFGLATAQDLKTLHQDNLNTPSLYAANVRAFFGENQVNKKVAETLENEPQHLFYLNNGVTALCQSINPTPESQVGHNGEFEIENLSIVNGAQTIGTIASKLPDDDSSAAVLMKIIEVPADHAELSDKIARATNLQTSVENLDFLSTHPRHQQFAATLKQSDITYEFKRSENYGINRLSPNRFTIQEAIEARICAGSSADLIHKLKTNSPALHRKFREDITLIFPDQLSARTLWRQVQISRIAQEIIESASNNQQHAYEKAFFTHGVFFLKHLIFAKMKHLIEAEEMNLNETEKREIRNTCDSLVIEALPTSDDSFGSGRREWRDIFKSRQNTQDLMNLQRETLFTSSQN